MSTADKNRNTEIDAWHPDHAVCSMCEERKPVARYMLLVEDADTSHRAKVRADLALCVGCLHEAAASVEEAQPDPFAAEAT